MHEFEKKNFMRFYRVILGRSRISVLDLVGSRMDRVPIGQDSNGLGPEWTGSRLGRTRMGLDSNSGPEWVGLDWVGPDCHGTKINMFSLVS